MKKVDTNKVTGVIFAGNNGFSYDDVFMPKSLLEVNGRTLLEYTVENMSELKLPEIYVFCDDNEINEIKYHNILARYENAKLIVCDSYDSTLTVVQNFIGLFSEYILFLYGNSPNSAKYLDSLMTSEMTVSCYDESTKKNKIRVNGKFLEPPYFIKRSLIYDSPAITWLTFFTMNKDKIKFVKDDGPCEFNSKEEFMVYKNYIREKF